MIPANNVNPITEDDIANYLSNTPDFFVRHAQVLGAVQLTSPHGNRAVSLQERQAEMLREKIKALEQRVMEMIRHGNENMVIADKLLRWARHLFLTRETRDLPEQVVAEIMAQASEIVLGPGKRCHSDIKIVRYPDRFEDEARGSVMFARVMALLEAAQNAAA